MPTELLPYAEADRRSWQGSKVARRSALASALVLLGAAACTGSAPEAETPEVAPALAGPFAGPFAAAARATWPTASGLPVTPGMTVYVTRNAIVFEDRTVAALEHGVVAALDPTFEIAALYEALSDAGERHLADVRARGVDSRISLHVATNASTPFATLISVLRTGAKIGFKDFELVVAAPDGVAQIPVGPPHTNSDIACAGVNEGTDDPPQPEPSVMSVEVWPTLMSLSRGAKTEELPIKLAHSDHVELVEGLPSRDPGPLHGSLARHSNACSPPIRPSAAAIS
jgi:hypothetical protein